MLKIETNPIDVSETLTQTLDPTLTLSVTCFGFNNKRYMKWKTSWLR